MSRVRLLYHYKMTIIYFISFIFAPLFALGNAQDDTKLSIPKLHALCLRDAYWQANELIEAGAIDINAVDPLTKDTALHILVERAQFNKETVKDEAKAITATMLIEKLVKKYNANLELQSDSGWTALNKALYLASDLVDYPTQVIDLLLSDCKAVNIPTRNLTPLHFAASSRLPNGRSAELTKKLMKYCEASISQLAVDSKGWTPLKAAMAANNMETVAILKKAQPFQIWTLLVSLLVSMLLGGAGYLLYKKLQNSKPSIQVNPQNSIE